MGDMMKTKASILKDLMIDGQWEKALSLAAKFQDLGKHRDAIKRGHEAIVHPKFYAQLGKDPAVLRDAGIEALKIRYASMMEG